MGPEGSDGRKKGVEGGSLLGVQLEIEWNAIFIGCSWVVKEDTDHRPGIERKEGKKRQPAASRTGEKAMGPRRFGG